MSMLGEIKSGEIKSGEIKSGEIKSGEMFSLIPRPSKSGRGESLVHTVCACT